VREALAERNLMVNSICPHLTEPISFLYPLKHRFWERPYVGAGVALYDILASLADNPLPKHRHIWKKDLGDLAPAVDTTTVHGGVRYWDVLVDDARHTMTVARTAAANGAHLASSARVLGMNPRSDHIEVEVSDLESSRSLVVNARAVINATGVWADHIQELVGDDQRDVKPSKGIHLVVPRDRIDSRIGMILRTEVSVLFVIPWGEHWIVGTTDTPWDLGLAHPAASRNDIDYLLKWVNSVLTSQLTREDVVGVYAGLRPLLTGESEQTSKLSREHAVIDDGQRVVTVAGGKYTTYRVMARDAVDALSPYLGALPPSRTKGVPLVGADGYQDTRQKGSPPHLDRSQWERLLKRYGDRVRDLTAAIDREPELGEAIVPDAPYLKAEIDYSVTHEGALHLDDVLTRRTRLSIETRDRGLHASVETARIMGRHLDWTPEEAEREKEHYRARVEAEIDSQRQPDDRTADAARMGAPDVRTGGS
jgi:glycerol-3-phosphate dehydrogenase